MYADMAELSASTIDRMLAGKPVDKSSLVAAFGVFELELNEYIGKREREDLVPSVSATVSIRAIAPTHDTYRSFFMDAKFTQNAVNQLMVERLVETLQDYLVGTTIELEEEKGQVIVAGVGAFEASREKDVKRVLRQLQALCTEIKLTGDVSDIVENAAESSIASV